MARAPLLALVALVSGYVVWSLAFVAVYAGHSLACIVGAENPRAPVLALWALHLALHAGLLWALIRGWRPAEEAVEYVRMGAIWLAATSAVVTLVTGAPALLLPPCA